MISGKVNLTFSSQMGIDKTFQEYSMKQSCLLLSFLVLAVTGFSGTTITIKADSFFTVKPDGDVFLQRKIFDLETMQFTFKVVNTTSHSIIVLSPLILMQQSTLHDISFTASSCLKATLLTNSSCYFTFETHVPKLDNPEKKQSFVAVYNILASWNHQYSIKEICFGVTVNPLHAYIFYQYDTPFKDRIRVCNIGYQGQLIGCHSNKPLPGLSASDVVTSFNINSKYSRGYMTLTRYSPTFGRFLYICNIDQSDGEITECKSNFHRTASSTNIKFPVDSVGIDSVHSRMYFMLDGSIYTYLTNPDTGELLRLEGFMPVNRKNGASYIGVDADYSNFYITTDHAVIQCHVGNPWIYCTPPDSMLKLPDFSPEFIAISSDHLAAYITKMTGTGPAIIRCPADNTEHLKTPCKPTGYGVSAAGQTSKLYPFSQPKSIAIAPHTSLVYIIDDINWYTFISVCQVNEQNHDLTACKNAESEKGYQHPLVIAIN